MARAVMLADASIRVNAEVLPPAVDEVAKLASGAESWLSITERLIEALPHVRMGPVETDDRQGLRLLSGTGAKGVGGSGPSPFVWMGWRRIHAVR
jgi:hypothetical protein